MATFESSKKLSEIQEAVLLPEDWYLVRIVKEPKVVPSNKKKQGLSVEDGGGDNWQIHLRVQSDNPEFHGRSFFISLPLPSNEKNDDGDLVEEKVYNPVSGKCVFDEKFERLGHWSAAFQGYEYEDTVDSKKIDLAQGDEAMIYVAQGYDWREGRQDDLVNNIDIFGSVPRMVE